MIKARPAVYDQAHLSNKLINIIPASSAAIPSTVLVDPAGAILPPKHPVMSRHFNDANLNKDAGRKKYI
jgi:hypothetical protein